MAVINISELPKEKLQAIAAKGVLGGLLIEEVDQWYEEKPGIVFHLYYVTSRSDKSKVHEVVVYNEAGKWQATCDESVPEADACKANRVGGIACSHVAVAFEELKRKAQHAFENHHVLTDSSLLELLMSEALARKAAVNPIQEIFKAFAEYDAETADIDERFRQSISGGKKFELTEKEKARNEGFKVRAALAKKDEDNGKG